MAENVFLLGIACIVQLLKNVRRLRKAQHQQPFPPYRRSESVPERRLNALQLKDYDGGNALPTQTLNFTTLTANPPICLIQATRTSSKHGVVCRAYHSKDIDAPWNMKNPGNKARAAASVALTILVSTAVDISPVSAATATRAAAPVSDPDTLLERLYSKQTSSGSGGSSRLAGRDRIRGVVQPPHLASGHSPHTLTYDRWMSLLWRA